jgi:hypothetical protein
MKTYMPVAAEMFSTFYLPPTKNLYFAEFLCTSKSYTYKEAFTGNPPR